jgi:uncharacterized OB-fold protein
LIIYYCVKCSRKYLIKKVKCSSCGSNVINESEIAEFNVIHVSRLTATSLGFPEELNLVIAEREGLRVPCSTTQQINIGDKVIIKEGEKIECLKA